MTRRATTARPYLHQPVPQQEDARGDTEDVGRRDAKRRQPGGGHAAVRQQQHDSKHHHRYNDGIEDQVLANACPEPALDAGPSISISFSQLFVPEVLKWNDSSVVVSGTNGSKGQLGNSSDEACLDGEVRGVFVDLVDGEHEPREAEGGPVGQVPEQAEDGHGLAAHGGGDVGAQGPSLFAR